MGSTQSKSPSLEEFASLPVSEIDVEASAFGLSPRQVNSLVRAASTQGVATIADLAKAFEFSEITSPSDLRALQNECMQRVSQARRERALQTSREEAEIEKNRRERDANRIVRDGEIRAFTEALVQMADAGGDLVEPKASSLLEEVLDADMSDPIQFTSMRKRAVVLAALSEVEVNLYPERGGDSQVEAAEAITDASAVPEDPFA